MPNFGTPPPAAGIRSKRETFKRTAAALLGQAEAVCRYLLPRGRRAGHEWTVGSIDGEPGHSLSVNLHTGVWKDFADWPGGADLISLWAAVSRIPQGEAKAEAEKWLGLETPRQRSNNQVRQVNDVPPMLPSHPIEDWWTGRPATRQWKYFDAAGNLACVVHRWDDPEGMRDKVIRPFLPDGRMKAPPAPRPLYNLPTILEPGSNALIVLVEGEKCCDALAELDNPDLVPVTNIGGANMVGYTDWTPLAGRHVLRWADNDRAGETWKEATRAKLLEVGAASIRDVVVPVGKADGWDCADAAPDERQQLIERCREAISGEPTLSDLATEGVDFPQAGPDAVGDRTPASEADPDWPPPVPIEAELRSVKPFDPRMLPEPLDGWVVDEAKRMACPPDFIAAAVLVALGSIVGARCAVNPKQNDSWQIVPNIWGAIVGDPASKKSPAMSTAFAPLNPLMEAERQMHEDALLKYRADKDIHDAKIEDMKARIKKAAAGKSDSEDMDACKRALEALYKHAPRRPPLHRYKTDDTTIEKAGELQQDQAGLLVKRDELTGWFASMDRSGHEADRPFWNESWNGNQSYDVDRIGRGHISIPNLCLSIFGGIQPDKLTMYLSRTVDALENDGLLQRFQMLVYPDPVPDRGKWRDLPPDKAKRDAAFAVFEKLATFEPLAWGAKPAGDLHRFPFFCFDEGGQKVFIGWFEVLYSRIDNEEEPLIQQHLAKYTKLCASLALSFFLVRKAAGAEAELIEREDVVRAVAWCEFLEDHARRCYGLVLDRGQRAAQTLAKRLEQGKLADGFTAYDVRHQGWRGLKADSEAQAALNYLEGAHWLRAKATAPGPDGGRPTVRYRINPAIRREDKKGRS
ncbi:DUF3987 domain-containing protein [Vineibacter terrae]|uniref:DUF3987 domain-containing protein n=1 Tax=Vineibacter terrae TaxID=2586908 RepID=A0A5C8PR18_9HYPH|nr:DUF3987 domain-containing protein [Vineibacter terrae]TXL78257.1 DUF3987 domain-containing protein [Vineibacter terrae]